MPAHSDSLSSCDLLLFGASGDLSCRKLFPALYQLEKAGLLPRDINIIACSKDSLARESYLELLKDSLSQFLPESLNPLIWNRLSEKIQYCSLNIDSLDDFQALRHYLKYPKGLAISYCAIPPFLYEKVCHGLSLIGLNQSPCRIVLEKPIGNDWASSCSINNKVAEYFSEDRIYRMDHYLGKETVLNLLALRFANSIFSSLWNNSYIEQVEISLAEDIGVEGRWAYYDKAGQVRDMLQNHVLQILSLVAMEPPKDLDAETIRQEKLNVLQALRPITQDNVQNHALRGQYTQNKVPGYLQEHGAIEGSQTETFVAVKAMIDNPRWQGVPFYLVTGKRLAKKQSQISIQFKPNHPIFENDTDSPPANQLLIRLQPDEGVELRIWNKEPGLGAALKIQQSTLDLSFSNHPFGDAYERLLFEILLGNQSLFVSREEIEQAWKWIDGIKESWEISKSPLYPYSANSSGPEELSTVLGNSLKTRNHCDVL